MSYLVIIRGLPGSGKSTKAEKLLHKGIVDVHFEADMFHMVGGTYEWKADNVQVAHRWCLDETDYALAQGKRVVVSNTFTTKRELKPYFEVAAKYNLTPMIIHATGDFGSIHNVPEETMEKMKNRFETDLSSLYNEETNVGFL